MKDYLALHLINAFLHILLCLANENLLFGYQDTFNYKFDAVTAQLRSPESRF